MSWLKKLWRWLTRKSSKPADVIPLKPEKPVTPQEDLVVSGPHWMKIAEAELGVKEVLGPGDAPRIVEYHSVTSGKYKDDEVPWCSSFACWVMEKAKIKSPRSARAKDWLNWGIAINQPKYGCIVVLSRDGGNHVGFYVGEKKGVPLILSGNFGNKVCVEPDGRKILGYRWPHDENLVA